MSATATDEAAVEARLQELRGRLGKKQHFEEAVNELAAAVRDRYAGASPALRKAVTQTPPHPLLQHPREQKKNYRCLLERWNSGVRHGSRLAVHKPNFDVYGTVGRSTLALRAWTWVCFDCNC